MSVNGNTYRRVVITGVGAVTPLGNDAETSWQNLLAGESGAGPITYFDSSDYAVHFACELKDFDPAQWIERKQARRMYRFAQIVLAAARQAEADSGVDIAAEPDRIGASIATGIGGIKSFQDCYDTLIQRGPDRVNPFAIPCIIPNMGAGWVSMELGTRGPLSSECTACAASNMAIGQGRDDIRLGRAARVEDPAEIRPDDVVPVFVGHPRDQAVTGNAGVVHEEVDVSGVREEALGFLRVGDVGLHGLTARLACDLFGLVLAGAVAERDARAGACKLERDGLADPA
jgi:hypothetical protein